MRTYASLPRQRAAALSAITSKNALGGVPLQICAMAILEQELFFGYFNPSRPRILLALIGHDARVGTGL